MWSVGCIFVELCSLCEMCATTELLAISSPVLSELIQTTPFSGWCVVLDSWELGAHTYDGASSRSHPLAHDKNGWVRHLIQFNSIFLQYLRWSLQTSVNLIMHHVDYSEGLLIGFLQGLLKFEPSKGLQRRMHSSILSSQSLTGACKTFAACCF